MANIKRSTEGLREHLFAQMEKLESGQTTPQDAATHAKLAQQIHNTIKIELEAARFISEQREVKSISVPSLSLGGDKNG